MSTRSYGQHCPIASALDLLGERWTLLILRELMGGPRRYADLRAELPGIATNLLSERLRLLASEGIIEQFDVPPPVSRTLYRLTSTGWRYVPPVIGSLAAFGAERLPYDPDQTSPLTGFLIGVLLGFDSHLAGGVDEDYRVVVDGRTFDVSVQQGALGSARGAPAVRLHAQAGDLVRLRRGDGGAPAARIGLYGPEPATQRFLSIFHLRLAGTSVPA